MATLRTRPSADLHTTRPSEPVFAQRFAGILSILGGLALWELVSRFVVANPLFLAAPTQIVGAIWSLAVSGELLPHISISAAEFAVGYVIASVVGVAIGMAMAESEIARKALEPWISG